MLLGKQKVCSVWAKRHSWGPMVSSSAVNVSVVPSGLILVNWSAKVMS